jgi:hypothetical protein
MNRRDFLPLLYAEKGMLKHGVNVVSLLSVLDLREKNRTTLMILFNKSCKTGEVWFGMSREHYFALLKMAVTLWLFELISMRYFERRMPGDHCV